MWNFTTGETIGFSAEDKHTITRSKGVALPDQMTLKISYVPAGDDQSRMMTTA